MRKLGLTFAVLSIALMATCVLAMAYPAVDLYEVRIDNAAAANIYAPGLGDTWVYAGNYFVAVRYPSGSGNPYVEYSSYCIEPAESPDSSLMYSLFPISPGTPFAAAAWILRQGYTTLAPAAQAAVWELTWDLALGNSYSLSAGNFRLYSGANPADVATIYNAAMAAMVGFDPSGYVIAHNPVGSPDWDWAYAQDYVIPSVPLPSTALLLGSGILAPFVLRLRRRLN